jgi:hypothetical protein
LNPFVVGENYGCGLAYSDEEAKNHVIQVLGFGSLLPETWYTAHAPYLWNYPMTFDNIERTLGSWTCDRLRGRPASHAGPGLLGQRRTFGIVVTTPETDQSPDTGVLQAALGACDAPVAYTSWIVTGANDSPGTFANAVANLKTHNVTSVFCFCVRNDIGYIQEDAEQETYFPEWIATSYFYDDWNGSMRAFGGPADQMQHLFGLTMQPMQRQFQDHPSTWANPGATYSGDVGQGGNDDVYRDLLLIASGIQMAGPHLTPETFQSGLQTTVFPNPSSPLMAGRVGFSGGSHAMTTDAAEIWWSVTAAGPYPDEPAGGPGAWCYVDGGARHSLTDGWPSGDPFFQGACDSGNAPANWSG